MPASTWVSSSFRSPSSFDRFDFVTYKWQALALPLMLLMYIYLFAVIIDIVIMWRKLKKKLIEKFGEQSVAKGMRSGSYAWSRAIQIRR